MRTRLTTLLISSIILQPGQSSAQTAKLERVHPIPASAINVAITGNPKELTIGDQVPDIEFNEVLNYHSKKARLSDFRAKLTILDFWSTSCTSCVALFPHMQALKDEFGDQLQIVLVNGKTKVWHDDREKIKTLLEHQNARGGVNIQLPIVFNCEELDNAFPYETLPHEAWLDATGKIIAITGATEVTAVNIKNILEGKTIQMHTKRDVFIDLQKNSLQELYYNNVAHLRQPDFSSFLIKGYIDGLHGEQGVRMENASTGMMTGWYATNFSLYRMYKFAYKNIMSKYPANQVLIETKDSSNFYKLASENISSYTNVYSYDITVQPTNYADLLTFVQHDFETIFKTIVEPEKRQLNCLIIKASPALSRSYTKTKDKRWELSNDLPQKFIRNYPIKEVLSALNNSSPVPLIDNTFLEANIDLDLPNNLMDINSIKSCLKRAGFIVNEESRILEVIVIKDK